MKPEIDFTIFCFIKRFFIVKLSDCLILLTIERSAAFCFAWRILNLSFEKLSIFCGRKILLRLSKPH